MEGNKGISDPSISSNGAMKEKVGKKGFDSDTPNNKKTRKMKDADREGRPHCQFFLVMKKRYCRLIPMRNVLFCGEHLDKSKEFEGKTRIPCPLDPKHTCFEHLVERHIKSCNSKEPDTLPAYIKEDINAHFDLILNRLGHFRQNYPHIVNFNDYDVKKLYNLTDEEFKQIIENIFRVRKSFPDIEKFFGIHPVVGPQFVRTDLGCNSLKHLAQTSALLNIMEIEGFLQSDTCYIEFGSGRGELSFYLGQVILSKNLKNCSIVMVDMASPRHKQDNKLQGKGIKIKRIRANIKDLIIENIDEVNSLQTKNIVGIAKHLCGNALDMALYAFVEQNNLKEKILGGVFATCCHHRCDMMTYVGMEYLKPIVSGEFNVLTQLASWAVDGDHKTNMTREIDDDALVRLARLTSTGELNKQVVGCATKEIIDWGRCEHFRFVPHHTIKARQVKYVDKLTTLEDSAIVLTRKTVEVGQLIEI